MMIKLWSERETAFRLELKNMRCFAGLSQQELADRLSKPQSFVSKYESGERQLKFLELELVCHYCNSSVNKFSESFSNKYPLKIEN
ncbi:MAG: helix-turn-helix transcriptional regulator [Alteromonadaceae bacterium]|nr:helix-turn-helix transcriptional regulator [Alteromonadaceae bacterium]